MVKLYYGGNARERSRVEAESYGKVLNPEWDGLTKDQANWVVEKSSVMYPTPVCFHLGPFDTIRPTSSDALLKTLEEHDRCIGFFLYAEDVQNVSPTIVSRSNLTYCPAPIKKSDSPLLERMGNPISMMVWMKGKSEEDLRKSLELLAGTEYWEKARLELMHPHITPSHLIRAFL